MRRHVVMAFAAVLFSSASSRVFAIEPEAMLRAGHFTCPERDAKALESIVDAQGAEAVQAAVHDAVFGGHCGGPLAFEVAVARLRIVKSPGGHAYACFHQLDPADHSDFGAFCTLERFVKPLPAPTP